eukprot:jgi/Bigna1/66391/fgenesh1_pg.1_\
MSQNRAPPTRLLSTVPSFFGLAFYILCLASTSFTLCDGSTAQSSLPPIVMKGEVDPLARWLANITIAINMPPLQKSFKVAGVTVGKVDLELNQIICKGIRIGNISSSYLKEQTSMRFILSGINVACSIPKFQAHLDGVSIGSGSGTAKVYQTSVQDTLQITGLKL